MKSLRKEWWVIFGAFLAINLLSAFLQPRLSFSGGRPWELATYYSIAEQLAHGLLPTGPGPAIFRIGAPFLAWLIPFSDITNSFLTVDLLANLVTICALVLLLRFYVESVAMRRSLIIFFMLHWLGPVRDSYFVPASGDAAAIALLSTGVYLIERYRRSPSMVVFTLIALISFFGVAFREIVLLVPLTFFVSTFSTKKPLGKNVMGALPLIFGVIGLLAIRSLCTDTVSYHFAGATINWGFAKSIPVWALGWFIAFGPVIALLFIDWQSSIAFIKRESHLAFFLAAVIALSIIGGSDTERFLLWSTPVVLILFGKWLDRNKWVASARIFMFVVVVLELISERAFWITPDLTNVQETSPIFLTSLSNSAYYFNLFSYHAPRSVSAVMLIEYLAVSAALALWALSLRKNSKMGIAQ